MYSKTILYLLQFILFYSNFIIKISLIFHERIPQGTRAQETPSSRKGSLGSRGRVNISLFFNRKN